MRAASDSFDGPFIYEELRERACAYVCETLAGQETNNEVRPTDVGQLDNPNEGDEDVNVVQRHPRQQTSPKLRPESDHERKSTGRQGTAAAQSVPRGRKLESEETRPGKGG